MGEVVREAGFNRFESMEPQVTKSGKPELENLETRYGVPAPPHSWTCNMILEATK